MFVSKLSNYEQILILIFRKGWQWAKEQMMFYEVADSGGTLTFDGPKVQNDYPRGFNHKVIHYVIQPFITTAYIWPCLHTQTVCIYVYMYKYMYNIYIFNT